MNGTATPACDHLLGVYEDGDAELRLSTYDGWLTHLRAAKARWAERHVFGPNDPFVQAQLKLPDERLLAQRFTLFRHCPDCGVKL